MKFYITVGQTENDKNQQTVSVTEEAIEAILEILNEYEESDEVSSAINKVLDDSGVRNG